MALNTSKCNYLTPMHFKGLTNPRQVTWKTKNNKQKEEKPANTYYGKDLWKAWSE